MSEKRVREWLLSQKNASPRFAKKIGFLSGKGGVGKTSVAIKMSCLLSEWGYRVLFLDCDHNLSNGVLKLGLPINDNFYSLITGEKSFRECLHKEGSLHILSGCNGNVDMFGSKFELAEMFMGIIASCEREYDYVMLDCPAGLGADMVALGAYCDYRTVIVTPDKSSLTDSYGLMKILYKKYGVTRNHLLVNKVSSSRQYEKIVKTMCETVEKFLCGYLHILGEVRYENISVDCFDKILLKDADSKIHSDISKITGKFTDKPFITRKGNQSSTKEGFDVLSCQKTQES